jgi:cysteine desulfuration protein SufE
MARSIDDEQRRIVSQFAQFGDGFDKYEFLIELGRRHPSLDAKYKTVENALPGCQSRVWLRAEEENGALRIEGDSDSVIVKGILALLLRVYGGRRAGDVAAAEPFFLRETGLSAGLSPTRAGGVVAIVKRLRELGENFAARKTSAADAETQPAGGPRP